MLPNSAGNDVPEITNEMPVDGHEPVERPEIILLPSIDPEPSSVRRRPSEPAEVDISVMARYVDVSVMVDDVLPVPVMGTPTYYIQGHRHHLIYPIVIRIGVMAAVVLNIEPDRRCD